MRTLSRIQALVSSSALLRAAIREGSLQVVYRQPPTVSADRLTVTWRVDLLVLDPTLADVAASAMRRLGFTINRSGEVLQGVQDFLLSAGDRAELDAEARALEQAAATAQQQAQQQATADTIGELQEQIEALRDELELLRLLPARAGRPGAPGAPGDPGNPGRDGRDLDATSVRLGDLQDVSELPAEQGQVLTWDQGRWEPKSPRMALASIGGGGAGAGLQRWEETEDGHLLPLQDGTQDLGSPERQLRSIHVSAQTVFIDGQPLSVNAGGQLTYQGEPLAFAADALPADGGLFTEDQPAPAPSGEPPNDPNSFG